MSQALLAEGFRCAVLAFLVQAGAIANELRQKLLGWRHTGGFSVPNQVRVAGEDREGRIKLAGNMIRAPMSYRMRFMRNRVPASGGF